MSRLIDADVLFKAVTEGRYTTGNIFKDMELQQFINEQPTAYDVEKVLAELKEYATSLICYRYTDCPYILDENISCENCGAMGAIDIVKRCGVE